MPRPKQKTSIFTLAKEFGVSAPTISKALSSNPEVSDDLRQRVRQRAEELSFRPHRPRRKTHNICALLDFEFCETFRLEGYAEAVVEGVYTFCQDHGAEFSIFGENTSYLESLDLNKELLLRNADGAVIIGASSVRSYFQNLERNRFPFCCVFDGPVDQTVMVDNHKVGEVACTHLVEQGYTNLAIARLLSGHSASSDRFVGFIQKAAQNHPHVKIKELVPDQGVVGYKWGYALLESWLAEKRPYEALFTFSEDVAIGVLSAAAIHGIQIPKDLAVLTCDNLSVCERAAPPLSVVDIPNHRAGYLAASQVWTKLTGKQPEGAKEPLSTPLDTGGVIARISTQKTVTT